MITIYMLSVPSYHELDEIEYKYVAYDEEDKELKRNVLFLDYRKPAIASMMGIVQILKDIPEYKKQALTFIVNDGALREQIEGTTTTHNRDVLKTAKFAREKMDRFSDNIKIKSVAGNYTLMKEWEAKLD